VRRAQISSRFPTNFRRWLSRSHHLMESIPNTFHQTSLHHGCHPLVYRSHCSLRRDLLLVLLDENKNELKAMVQKHLVQGIRREHNRSCSNCGLGHCAVDKRATQVGSHFLRCGLIVLYSSRQRNEIFFFSCMAERLYFKVFAFFTSSRSFPVFSLNSMGLVEQAKCEPFASCSKILHLT
jgi:hypothetical protein